MASNMINNKSEFWKNVRNNRSNKMKFPSFIGGVKGQENIVEKWRSYYHQIFNSTPNSIDNKNYNNVESMKGIEFKRR